MSNTLKVFLAVITLIISLGACSSQEGVISDEEDSASAYPAWYSPAGFAEDSTTFHGFATAVSADSVIAIANAELQARINLESAIAYKLEEVRSALQENGQTVATQADFILTLRNAHQQVQDAANEQAGEARSKDGYYNGFAKVSISKSDFMNLLESGFRGKSRYWQTLSSSSAFKEEIQ